MKDSTTRRTDADSLGSELITWIFRWITYWKIGMRGVKKPDSRSIAIAGEGVEFSERNRRDRRHNSGIFRRDLPFF